MGAKWNKDQNTWYAPKGSDLNKFQEFMTPDKITVMEKTYLNVPYDERNKAKDLGAWFDGDRKQWFAPELLNIKDYPS